MGELEKRYEVEAKRVLAALLGGTAVDRDVRPAQRVRDFDLVDDSGRTIHAVEVTSVQLPAARQTATGIRRMREKELGLTVPWSVLVHETANVPAIEKNAPNLLNSLQAEGVERFGQSKPARDQKITEVIQRLNELGVAAGYQMPDWPQPRLVAGGFGSGTWDSQALTDAIAKEMLPNVEKLKQAPVGATRHLFVWLNDSEWHVSGELRMHVPLATVPPPKLLEGIDVVWAAVADGPDVTCAALITSSGEEWQYVSPPDP